MLLSYSSDMGHKYIAIQAVYVLAIVSVTWGHETNCAHSHNIGTLLKIDSRRNDSGHWVSQVELVHSDKGERKGDPWTVDVHHRTSSCGGDSDGEVTVGATLVSPRLVPFKEEETPQTSYRHVGILGLHHITNKVINFLYSNSTTTWDIARADCENLTCSLIQSDLKDFDGTEYMETFLRIHQKIHVGFRRSNVAPFDIKDLSDRKMDRSALSTWGANSLVVSESSACVSFDGTKLNAEPCDTPMHFMCVCHGLLHSEESEITEEPTYSSHDYNEE